MGHFQRAFEVVQCTCNVKLRVYLNITPESTGYISGPLAADPSGQLNILGHDGHPLGVDGTEVGVLKESHQVSLTSLLESHHSRALEPQVSLEVLSNLTDKTLEGQLADEQLSGLLVPRSNK